MEGRQLYIFITDEQGRSYYVENGIVKKSSLPKPLPVTPDGWQDILIQYSRESKYFGINREFTLPMGYVGDGAKIVRKIFYEKGIEEKLFLVIHRKTLFIDNTDYYFYYKFLYRGEIDLSKLKDQKFKVTAPSIEGGLTKYIKANENVTYEIPMDVPEAEIIKADGLILGVKINFITQTGLTSGNHLIGALFTTSEGSFVNATPFTIYTQAEPGDLTTSLEYFFVTTKAISNVTLKGSVTLTASFFSGTYNLYLKSNLGRNDSLGSHAFTAPATFTINFDYTFNAAENEKFFLVGDVPLTANYQETSFTIDYDFILTTTHPKSLPAQYVFKQLISKISEGKYQGESDYLNDLTGTIFEGTKINLTCGDAIRGITGSVLKTSLADFFQSLNVPLNIAMSIVLNKANITAKGVLFDSSIVTADLGEVADLSISPAGDYYFNELAIGYPDQTYEDVNGREEFNNTYNYTSPVTKITKKLELTSKYRSDMYGFEFTRINLEGKTTTDSAGDNAVWMVHLNGTPITESVNGVDTLVYQLNRDINTNVTAGLIDPITAFNVAFHPMICLRQHGNYLRSCLYSFDNELLKFQTTTKNKSVTIDFGTKIYKADTNISIGSLDERGERLFKAILFESDVNSPNDLVDLFADFPIGCLSFTFDNKSAKGFTVKCGQQPISNGKQQYQLLCTADTDLNQFING